MPVHREQFAPDNEVTMPLGVGDFGGDESAVDPLAGSIATKKLPTGVLIIVGVVVCAIAGLFFMKFVATASAKNLLTDEVSASVDRFIDAIDGTTDAPDEIKRLLDRKESPLAWINVEIDEIVTPGVDLKRDPFQIVDEVASTQVQPADSAPTSEQALKSRQAMRRADFERAAASFELKMIMGGSKPLANLNGMIVGVGQVAVSPRDSVEFTVKSIEGDTVVLEGRDDSISLILEFTVVLDRDL
jgi:hypothetical protein